MRFTNPRSYFLWTVCLVFMMLSVPAVVSAQKNKNSGSSSPPPSRPAAQPQRQAPANRPATTSQRPGANNTTRPGTATSTRPRTANTTRPGTATNARPGAATRTRPGATTRPRTATTTRATAVRPGTIRPVPQRTIRDVGGHKVGYDPAGHVRTIQTRSGATIYHGPHNEVRGVRNYPGGRHVEFAGRNYGHMERNYARGYRMRTYYENGRYRAVVYRSYLWRGRPYYVYAPYYYYRPAYYGWAYAPWGAPVYYQWGWAGNPWYGYYGSYFAPAPFYPAADLWLTDYILAENLKMAYDAQQNAAPQEAAGTPPENANVQLTPEVKQMIAEEVKQQLAAEKAAAARPTSAVSQSGPNDTPPPALDPNHTVFVVASTLDVATPVGDCELTPGDVINRIDDTPDSDDMVQVRVAASKQGDCLQGSKPAVKVADLQDMSNRFREQVDSGLQQLAANSGKNGLPAAPDTSTSSAPDVPTPEPDKDVYAQMQGLQKEADQAEADVRKGSTSGQTGGQ